MSDNKGSDLIVAFGAGILMGAVAGLLLAPSSGNETRRRIGEAAEGALDKGKEFAGTAQTKSQEGVQAATEFVNDQKERLGEAFREGKQAYQRETTKA